LWRHATPERFDEEFNLIAGEGLAPVAARAFKDRPEHFDSPSGLRFRRIAFDAELREMAVDVRGAEVVAALGAADIPVAIAKGPAIAEFHPDGWPRPYADLDLLVAMSDFSSAVACAEALGFVRPQASVPQWSWFDRRCREAMNPHSNSDGNVDFHHHVPPWKVGLHLPVDVVIARSTVHQFCGTEVRFVRIDDPLVICGLHILNDQWKGKRGLASWRDVILLITMMGVDEARSAFRRARIGWVFDLLMGIDHFIPNGDRPLHSFGTVGYLVSELAIEVPESGFSASKVHRDPSPIASMRLAMLGWSNDSAVARHRWAWATRLPLLNALAFVGGSAIPSPSYVGSRHESYLHYWRRGIAETASAMSGSDRRRMSGET
jgi:hypothetical protein